MLPMARQAANDYGHCGTDGFCYKYASRYDAVQKHLANVEQSLNTYLTAPGEQRPVPRRGRPCWRPEP